MADESQFSAEAQRRFAELKPENYKKELRRLSRKISEAQFLFGLVIFLGAITPLFALAMTSVSGSFAIIWTLIMVYAVVKAFRRIENPMTHMEVRILILKAQHREFLERATRIAATISENEQKSAKGRRKKENR